MSPHMREKLIALRKAKGLTQQEIADRLSMSRSLYVKLERGERRLNEDHYIKLSKLFGVGLEDLVTTLPKNEHDSEIIELTSEFREVRGSMVEVPVIGIVQAGAFIEAFEDDPMEHIPFFSSLSGQNLFGLRVIGDSMDLVFPEGTFLICQRLSDYMKPLRDGIKVIVKRRAAGDLFEATVKEASFSNNTTTLTPRSSNPKHKPVQIKNGGDHHHDTGVSDVEIWAVVVWSMSPQG